MDSGRAITKVTLSAKIIRADSREENLGMIQYWHRNPLRRVLFRLAQVWKGFRNGD